MANVWTLDQTSVIDPVGRIVRRGNTIGRVISPRYVDETKNILELAERKHWFDAGLISTKISGETIKEWPLVLEHERIPFVTQRGEWSAIGLQRAALCVLRLSLKLLEDSYCVHDPHSWNILFSATRPSWIDFTSIRLLDQVNQVFWFDQFNHYFLAPLFAFAAGKRELARSTTFERMKGVGLSLLKSDPAQIADLPERKDYGQASLEYLYQLIEGLRFNNLGGEWDDYAQPTGADKFRSKDRTVNELLSALDFKTAIDIGANRGLHSRMCVDLGAKVIACDVEEGCVNDLFVATESSSKDILPLVLDIVNFSGTGGAFNTEKAANERLQCDLVIALALVHHVSFRRRFYPDAVLSSLISFTNESALIEFIPDDDWHVAQWGLPPLDNYTLDGFRGFLRQHFESVENIPIEPAPRSIFVCRGKRRSKHSLLTEPAPVGRACL